MYKGGFTMKLWFWDVERKNFNMDLRIEHNPHGTWTVTSSYRTILDADGRGSGGEDTIQHLQNEGELRNILQYKRNLLDNELSSIVTPSQKADILMQFSEGLARAFSCEPGHATEIIIREEIRGISRQSGFSIGMV